MRLSLVLVETMTEKVRGRPAGRKSGLMREMKASPNFHVPLLGALQPACWPGDNGETGSVACRFILAAWHAGATRAPVANLVAGISDSELSLRNGLAGARRLHMA